MCSSSQLYIFTFQNDSEINSLSKDYVFHNFFKLFTFKFFFIFTLKFYNMIFDEDSQGELQA